MTLTLRLYGLFLLSLYLGYCPNSLITYHYRVLSRKVIIDGCVAFAKKVGSTRIEAELLPQCWEQVSQLPLAFLSYSVSTFDGGFRFCACKLS